MGEDPIHRDLENKTYPRTSQSGLDYVWEVSSVNFGQNKDPLDLSFPRIFIQTQSFFLSKLRLEAQSVVENTYRKVASFAPRTLLH